MHIFRTLPPPRFFRSSLLAVLIAALLLMAPAPVGAQENITITFTAAEDPQQSSPTVGDPVLLMLEIHHPSGSRAITPELPEKWGDFEVRAQNPAQIETHPDGSHTTRQEITVVLFSPGEHTTPPLEITLRTAAGEYETMLVPQLTIDIRSVLQPGDTQLHDLKPQAVMKTPFPWLAAGLLAVAAVLLALRYARRLAQRRRTESAPDRETPAPQPPQEAALAELRRIEQMRLPEQARFREHYTLLGDCLRQYLGAGFGLNALEQTTAELHAGLERAEFPPQAAQRLLNLLQECDLVKFARFQPDSETANRHLQEAIDLVSTWMPSTETQPHPPEAKG